MKTLTILHAYEISGQLCDLYGGLIQSPKRRSRQYTTFRAALLARIEAGDRAREEAVKLRANIDTLIHVEMNLISVIRDVEWIEIRRGVNTAWGADVEYGVICPWCKEFFPNARRDEAAHDRDCPRQLALQERQP